MKAEFQTVWDRHAPKQPIRKLEDFLKQVRAFTKPRRRPIWEFNNALFRGTPYDRFELLPSLPRCRDARKWLSRGLLLHIERHTTLRFQQQSLFYDDFKRPPDEDFPSWWEIMQNHGARTRLLDWTISEFLALYFAVADNPDRDGMVWMVHPGALQDRMAEQFPNQYPPKGNKTELMCELPDEPLPQGHVPKALREAHMKADSAKERKYRRIAGQIGRHLIFRPSTYYNKRMAAQRGWFSIAADPMADHGEIIGQAFGGQGMENRWWCHRVVIPREAKSAILRDLYHMNTTGETVFCGLDGLGKSASELVDLLNPTDHRHRMIGGGLWSALPKPTVRK